jgi:tetratricopeptide (TPR) repeat protein
MTAKGKIPKIQFLYPMGSNWSVDQYINDFSSLTGQEIDVLLENESTPFFDFNSNSFISEIKDAFSIRSNQFDFKDSIESGSILMIPGTYPYMNSSMFQETCRELSLKGVFIVVILFEALAIDEMKSLIAISDSLITFDYQDYYTALASGVAEKKVSVLPLPLVFNNIDTGNSGKSQKILVPDIGLSKNDYDELIKSAYTLAENADTYELIVFRTPKKSIQSTVETDFPKELLEAIDLRGLSKHITLMHSGISYWSFSELFKNSKMILLLGGSHGSALERRGVTALAVVNGVPIVRASSTSLLELNDLSIEIKPYKERALSKSITDLLFSNSTVLQMLPLQTQKMFEFERIRNCWSDLLSNVLLSKHETLTIDLNMPMCEEESSNTVIMLNQKLPRVLLKNRSNALSHPGGDTVVMQRLVEGLEKEGIDAVLDVEEKEDVKNYDLVHLFNFAIKEVTEAHARDCVQKQVPYVVTTLYEDWPKFYNQMAQMYVALDAYVTHGQPVDRWDELEIAAKAVTPSAAWDNSFSANNAEVLIATGLNEEESLFRDYPSAKKIVSISLGCEVSKERDGGELFRKRFGIDNFILSVGRLEWRKNQLMLLKALEDTDHTIVFAASSFTYQEKYSLLCKNFKRKGKTIFLERLSPEELASAYQAANMHVLPSWFELPGLVTLEAGRYGTPVVVSDSGSTRSYVEDFGFYCKPDSASSIRYAVEKAEASCASDRIADHFSKFTWDSTIKEYAKLYQSVLSGVSELPNASQNEVIEVQSQNKTEEVITFDKDTYEDICNNGDIALAAGKENDALIAFENAYKMNPDLPRAIRSIGAVRFYEGKFDIAEPYFAKALSVDPRDVRSMLGKGAILWQKGEKERAYILYKQASDMSPADASVVLYLVNACYELLKYEELEDSLRNYLRINPDNISIQYCLAGCYFKQEKYSAASGVLERMLVVSPKHEQALELKVEIEKVMHSKSEMHRQDVIPSTEPLDSLPTESMLELTNVEIVQNGNSVTTADNEIKFLEELKKQKKFDELNTYASRYIEEMNLIEDAKTSILILKAEALGSIGKIDEARGIFIEMLSQNNISPKVYCGLGALEGFEGNWEDALGYFEKALEKHPNVDVPLAGLGMSSRSLGLNEDAWNYYTEALRRNAQNMQALFGLLELGYYLQRLDEVEDHLREYLELKPVDISMIYSLAGCLYAQGKSSDAVSELKNILIFEPDHVNAKELLDKIESASQTSAVM